MRRNAAYLILGQYIVMLSLNIPFLHQAESNVKSNTRIKRYPDGSVEILVASRPIFGTGWESAEPQAMRVCRKKSAASAADLDRARRRAAARVRDIALCNDFAYFVTLTLDARQIERYDIKPVLAKMRVWLDNRVRRKGLKYVLVPEHHKDGAIHFHGFFSADGAEMVDSGTLSLPGEKRPRKPRSATERAAWCAQGAHVVYNVCDWSLGFSTAIPVYGEYGAAVAYCCKYVGKEGAKIGGRWYYSGGALSEPRVDFTDMDLRDLEAAGGCCFDLPDAGLSMCIWRGRFGSL
jgi:hypothetical protein